MLQPINRFDRVDRPSAIRHLECNGTEDHISQCGNINTEILNTCGRYEVAGVVCQSMYLIMIFVIYYLYVTFHIVHTHLLVIMNVHYENILVHMLLSQVHRHQMVTVLMVL